MTLTARSPRRSRLACWVGATYLLLFLLGPWAHDHSPREDRSRIHHVHGFAAIGDDGSGGAEPTSVPAAQHDPGDTDFQTGHRVDAHDGPAHHALQPDRPARLPGAFSSQLAPAAGTAVVPEPQPATVLGSDRRILPTHPTSSGQLALHLGTDVSPPGA